MNRTEALAYLKSQGANVEILGRPSNSDEAVIQIAEGIQRLLKETPTKPVALKKYCKRCKCAFPEIHANGLCDFCLFDAMSEQFQRRRA